MVAWELGTIYEKNGHTEEAVKWYRAAWERFRRADWKKKSEEALTRLGAETPAEAPPSALEVRHASGQQEAHAKEGSGISGREDSETGWEGAQPDTQRVAAPPADGETGPAAASEQAIRGKRRRGRRGGRGRHRRGDGASGQLPPETHTGPAAVDPGALHQPNQSLTERPVESGPEREGARPAVAAEAPLLPSERSAHGHRDPGLASRMAQLESMLRRLVGSPLHKLDTVEEAPAGPGVFLLSDSDQTAYYYVEACQTLRVGLSNLMRGGSRGNRGSGGRGGARSHSHEDLKARLAEHLEISESKVSQYLRDHCVVRWIQLDDEAPHLAHFAIGVLRTPLNSD
jgi:hypothetical protein